MKLLKAKLAALVVCSAFIFPNLVGAAAADTSTTSSTTTSPPILFWSIGQTKVNGILVPGIYITNNDSKVAYIPGGVGLVVVDKSTALPFGSYYVK